jgi:hypothetical protein
MRPFPVVEGLNPSSWNIHHVNLDTALRLDLNKPKDLEWVNFHVGAQLSDRERTIRERHQTQRSEVPASEMLLSVKDSLHLFFGRLAGLHGRKSSHIFGLVSPDDSPVGVFALLFVRCLFLDLPAFTIVADVAALPLDRDLMPTLRSRTKTSSISERQQPRSSRGSTSFAQPPRDAAHGRTARTASMRRRAGFHFRQS